MQIIHSQTVDNLLITRRFFAIFFYALALPKRYGLFEQTNYFCIVMRHHYEQFS